MAPSDYPRHFLRACLGISSCSLVGGSPRAVGPTAIYWSYFGLPILDNLLTRFLSTSFAARGADPKHAIEDPGTAAGGDATAGEQRVTSKAYSSVIIVNKVFQVGIGQVQKPGGGAEPGTGESKRDKRFFIDAAFFVQFFF